jgi:hypothetical protein
MRCVKDTWKANIALLLCAAFSFQVLNRAVFTHTHVLDDGTMVVHAHPYDKPSDSSPTKHHHHSKDEIVLLNQADLLYFVFLGSFTLVLFSTKTVPDSKPEHTHIFSHPFCLKGRSPPCTEI